MWNMRVDDEDDKESEAGEYDGDVASWQSIMDRAKQTAVPA